MRNVCHPSAGGARSPAPPLPTSTPLQTLFSPPERPRPLLEQGTPFQFADDTALPGPGRQGNEPFFLGMPTQGRLWGGLPRPASRGQCSSPRVPPPSRHALWVMPCPGNRSLLQSEISPTCPTGFSSLSAPSILTLGLSLLTFLVPCCCPRKKASSSLQNGPRLLAPAQREGPSRDTWGSLGGAPSISRSRCPTVCLHPVLLRARAF